MRHLLLVCLLALAPGLAAARCDGIDYRDTLAEDTLAAITARADEVPYGTGILWQATRGTDRILIVGTMHLPDPRSAAIRDRVVDEIAAADLLLVEAGPEEQAAVQSAMTRDPTLVFTGDGPTLPEILDAETWDALRAAASARGLPSVLVAKMQPWYVALLLAVPPCAMAELAAGRMGLDNDLMDAAAAAGVPIAALEPWDTLFAILQGEGTADQIEALRLGLVSLEAQESLFAAMLNAYYEGEIAQIWEVSRHAARDLPGLTPDEAAAIFAETEQKTLIDRNRAWMDPIRTATETHDRVVIAAGAAHLPGETGILALLAAEGWLIAPLD